MQLGFVKYFDSVPRKQKAFSDEWPIPFGPGDHRAFLYAERGSTPTSFGAYKNKNANGISCIDYAGLVKIRVQENPYKEDDAMKFYTEDQPVRTGLEELDGEAVINILDDDVTDFYHDLHGRSGRKKKPDQCHFHPKIKPSFAAVGIREIHLPAAGHDFNPEEEFHRWIQDYCSNWRPDNWQELNRETLYGPQTFAEVEMAVNDAVVYMKSDESKQHVRGVEELQTLEQRLIYKSYNNRGKSSYFHKMMANQRGKYKEAYDEVVAKRASIPRRTRFSVKWDPHDGKGAKMVQCLNLEFKSKQLTKREINAAKKKLSENKFDPPTTVFIPTTHDGAALTSTRITQTQAQIDDRAPKDEDDTWKNWVFEEMEVEDGEYFAAKIKGLGEDDDGNKIIKCCQIKKSVSTKETTFQLDDFLESIEDDGYVWLGNDGKAVKQAKERFKDNL